MNSNCFAIFFSGIIAMSVQISIRHWKGLEPHQIARFYLNFLMAITTPKSWESLPGHLTFCIRFFKWPFMQWCSATQFRNTTLKFNLFHNWNMPERYTVFNNRFFLKISKHLYTAKRKKNVLCGPKLSKYLTLELARTVKLYLVFCCAILWILTIWYRLYSCTDNIF